MKLVEAKIPNKKNGIYEANIALLDEFLNSKMECAEVVDYRWASAHSAYASLHEAIKQRGFNGLVRVSTKGTRVFLVRGCGLDG